MADDSLTDSEAFELHSAIADRAAERASADSKCKARVARVIGARKGPFVVMVQRVDGTPVTHVFSNGSFSAEVSTTHTVEGSRP